MVKNLPKNVLKICWKIFLDFLFPFYCVGCKKNGSPICEECLQKIEVPQNPLPPPSPIFESLFAAAFYEEGNLIAKLIQEYKYHFSYSLADFLGPILIEKLKPFSDLFEDSLVVPIPLHPKRKRWRGFNQSELLARKISGTFGLPIETRKLIRIRNTEPQAKLTREERLKNMEGAFLFAKSQNTPEKIFLVDDVVSTGQTLIEAAKAIKEKCPEIKLFAIVLALPRRSEQT